MGHFVEPTDSLLNATGVEVKWAIHEAGEQRAGWTEAATEVRTTLVILISGRFSVEFPGEQVDLKDEGDYATFGPGVAHSWRAHERSVVLTVRWPSVA